MPSSKHSRRTLLKTFLAAGAAAPLSRLFMSDPAYGADAPPLRFAMQTRSNTSTKPSSLQSGCPCATVRRRMSSETFT